MIVGGDENLVHWEVLLRALFPRVIVPMGDGTSFVSGEALVLQSSPIASAFGWVLGGCLIHTCGRSFFFGICEKVDTASLTSSVMQESLAFFTNFKLLLLFVKLKLLAPCRLVQEHESPQVGLEMFRKLEV